jgi:hypothetical protein
LPISLGSTNKSKEALASAILSRHFEALPESLTEGGSGTAGACLGRHFQTIAPSAPELGVSPLLLISTLAAEGPALPCSLVQQIGEGVRVWSSKIAALIALAQADGQINAAEGPDLLAALFINCWQAP